MGTLKLCTHILICTPACEHCCMSQLGGKKSVQRLETWEGAGEGSSKGLFPTTPLGQSSSRLGALDP